MAENNEKKVNKSFAYDPKLHFGANRAADKTNSIRTNDVNINDDAAPKDLSKLAGNVRTPAAGTDLGNSRPDDTKTGRWQTTTLKGDNPEQTQSPDVGADNSVEGDFEKNPFRADYGTDNGNVGSRMTTDTGSGRGEKGLKGATSGRNSKGLNQSENMGSHVGNRHTKNQ